MLEYVIFGENGEISGPFFVFIRFIHNRISGVYNILMPC